MKEYYYYWDKQKKMMLINNFQTWKNNNGEGDALWRTGIAYITNPLEKYKNGIMKAFRKKDNGKYQACRCNPEIDEHNVSRDQVILAWSSLYINGDEMELKELVKNTPYRLSKRYMMTPTMWFWSRGLIGNKFFGQIALFFQTLELLFNVPYNKLIKKLIGYEEYSLDEIENMMNEIGDNGHSRGETIRLDVLNSKWKTFLWKANFPGYGLHLASWVNYTGPNGIFKSINNYLIQQDMAKHNLLLKLLTGGEVIEEEIDDFKSHEEWIWSQRMTKMNRNQVIPFQDELELDKEILRTIKKRNKKLSK